MGLSRAGFHGLVTIDLKGAAIAARMLEELESVNDDGSAVADDSALENGIREGRQFRNVVAEYAVKAHAAGPAALEGFYAVLSDYISTCCQGSTPSAEWYNRFCRKEARP